MKFCVSCGKQIDDSTAFCPYCGAQQPQQPQQPQQQYQFQGPAQSGPASAVPPNKEVFRCPNCHSTDLIPTTETTTDVSGGGYGAGKGCLGWLLFGPLGLLCGLCGRGTKSQTTSKTYWVCKTCGTKFLSPADQAAEEAQAEVAAMSTFLGLLGFVEVVIFVIVLYMSRAHVSSFLGLPMGFYVFLCIVLPALGMWGFYFAKKKKDKTDKK